MRAALGWTVALGLLAGCQAPRPMVTDTARGELHVSVVGDAQAPALELSYDVGAVAVGQRKELTVRATNVGEDPLQVLGVSLGSGGNGSWFVRDVTGRLEVGQSVEARVTFVPVAVGAQATTVTFSHDADAQLPVVRLSGSGT